MSESEISYAARTQTVSCPASTRPREDDQIVELFLHAWRQGCFSRQPDWLPQSQKNVEVIATDETGTRLAVEHTRLFAFEHHKYKEELLRPVAEALEAEPRLDIPGRRFDFLFFPTSLGKLLGGCLPLVEQKLRDWAVHTLPAKLPCEQFYEFQVPIPLPNGKTPRVAVDVRVSEREEGFRPVSVRGYLPTDRARLTPVVQKALRDKLQKLADADAELRVLLLDLPIRSNSPAAVIERIRELADHFPLLERISHIAVANTVAYPEAACVRFWVWEWNAGAEDCTDLLLAIPQKIPLAPVSGGPLSHLAEQAQKFAAAAKAHNTVRAYAADWNDFRQWCEAHALPSLPAEPGTVALYLTDRATTLKTSSLARRLTTISRAHQAAGFPSPAAMQHAVVSEVWKWIKHTKGTAEVGKTPFLTADLRLVLKQRPAGLLGLRDRALLLVGFAGGFRRSELAGLTVEDLRETPEGIVIQLNRSKTDQEGQGRRVALAYGSDPQTCPVRVLRTWLEAARITAGPLFRGVDQFGFVSETKLHPDSVAFIVKRAVGKAGLDAMEYAGHSLRAGLATQAAMNGASELAIMKQTGHRSLATVRKYIREGSLFRDNAATRLGL
ncbi:MAG TPA: site-specific integrase [Bryobacteraceae bacterium]|nr:site-specific integrase [Bryobacteraceae bacterium]